MQTKNYKLLELLILFLLIPISFVFSYNAIAKLSIGLTGFLYILFILLKVEKVKFQISKNIDWKSFWKSTLLKLFIIAIITSLYVYFTASKNLFIVVLNKPLLWILILLFYSIFSVYPQELLYRNYFFKRYKDLFKNEKMFLLINAFLFSLAHLLFKNILVLILTFIGGLLFAYTYNKTKSTFLVSVEHSIYGCWLFTVGMGNMLGFPS
ncbi:hypothetical protein OBPA_24390 [Polaribacter sp. OB-PA-B3]